jgi:protein-tyrosine phosphatase
MAEFMFKQLVAGKNLADRFEIASAAVSREELGNPVYPPARRILNAHGIDCSGKYARQMTVKDYEYYDLLICMDNSNLRNMQRICGGDPEGKMALLKSFTDHPGEVSDPWYSGDFETTWEDIADGLEGLLRKLTN